MGTLILLRHGQSEWNLQNRFTGWEDVDLSPKGVEEAEKSGELLLDYQLDRVFSSVLIRAIRTAELALLKRDPLKRPTITLDKALNERNYGDLQGLNKDETRKKYGKEQVHIWRRSYETKPPGKGGESLKDTVDRVIPYFEREILPLVCMGESILVAAHGNSLRALIKDLEGLSDDEIVKVEIPTGVPIVYKLNSDGQIESKRILN